MNVDKCEIRVYDKDFNWLDVAVLAESVQFTRELYGVGGFEIHIHPDKSGAFELIKRGNVIVVNGDGRRSAVVRSFYMREERNGPVFVINGDTGQGFAKQRITVPPTNAQVPNALGWDKIDAPAETILKHYAGRSLVYPYNDKRKIPNMIMAPDLGRGLVFPWKSRYQKLSDELYNIGTYAEMGYEIYADIVNKQWAFDVVPGVDRTRGQGENDPVWFDMGFHNISQYKYSEDYSQHRSTGYVGGAGEDENRLVYTLGADIQGEERWEEFLDCGNVADISELIYYGEQKLNGFKFVKNIEADTLPRVFVFEKDYFLGDEVTVKVDRLGIEFDTRITAVKEIWERPDGYRTVVRFGGNLPNLFTVLNTKKEVS